MNLLHMKYAVEVAAQGSLNKAAETLHIAQPNISRAVKELEGDLGITLFSRTAKGMVLTVEGEEFVSYARSILKQIDEVEMLYKRAPIRKQKFSVSVPRACYIADAFVAFSGSIGPGPAEVIYRETNAQRTIENVLHDDYKLGIIRYAASYDKYFKDLLEEKELSCELIAEFNYVLIMNRNSPLARLDQITLADLADSIEIAHADPYVPTLSLSKVIRDERSDWVSRRIFVFERASQLELLAENPQTFMWVSPASEKMLDRYDLVQRSCVDNHRLYKDVLIHRVGYKLTQLDKQFITCLCDARRKCIP